jgi:hypothetical protein
MSRHLPAAAVFLMTALAAVVMAAAYPKPSPYPISWELSFDPSLPKRFVLTPPGANTADSYWYITYSVANESKDEQQFLPTFEMLTDDGQVIRSDQGIPDSVLAEIRIREKNRNLLSVVQIAGTQRVGRDQTRYGMAVWKEPYPRMGKFTIFVSGLSGEAVILKDDNGQPRYNTDAAGKKQPVVLCKTLRLEYQLLGDETYPGNDPLKKLSQDWVMR